eukprot:gene21864-biopygen16212
MTFLADAPDPAPAPAQRGCHVREIYCVKSTCKFHVREICCVGSTVDVTCVKSTAWDLQYYCISAHQQLDLPNVGPVRVLSVTEGWYPEWCGEWMRCRPVASPDGACGATFSCRAVGPPDPPQLGWPARLAQRGWVASYSKKPLKKTGHSQLGPVIKKTGGKSRGHLGPLIKTVGPVVTKTGGAGGATLGGSWAAGRSPSQEGWVRAGRQAGQSIARGLKTGAAGAGNSKTTESKKAREQCSNKHTHGHCVSRETEVQPAPPGVFARRPAGAPSRMAGQLTRGEWGAA